MPAPRVFARSGRKLGGYPYGVGDGTRDAPVADEEIPAEETNDNKPADDNDDNRNNENDRDDNNRGGVYAGPDYGVGAEQIINVLPDQTIKLVVTQPEKTTKKEHPQERIDKFWTNFEPEYLGGITRILPDTVGQVVTPTGKQQDISPKAVHSYEDAKRSCIKDVKRIIRECKANNQKYTDPHFDLERDLKVTQNRDCLYGLTSWDGEYNPGDVKRITVSQTFMHPSLMLTWIRIYTNILNFSKTVLVLMT